MIFVVGGGVAGLVAARTLVLEGAEVTLLEASDRLGGTVTSHEVGGLTLDAGAESFATRRGTVAALATSLGLAADVVEPNPAGAWLQRTDGSTVPLPATNLLGIPGVPLASDVLSAIGARAAFRAQLDQLMPGTVGARSTTLGELVRRRMGRGVLDALVTPIVQGIHSRHPDELDLDRVAPGLRAALLREGSLARAVRELRGSATAGAAVNGIRGGVHRLVIELTADLARFGVDVRLGSRVTAVDATGVTVSIAATVGEPSRDGVSTGCSEARAGAFATRPRDHTPSTRTSSTTRPMKRTPLSTTIHIEMVTGPDSTSAGVSDGVLNVADAGFL